MVNDHVAFRTFANSPIALEKLAPQLESMGYRAYGEFRFEEKHLLARCYQHENASYPKVFLSELLIEELPPACQAIIERMIKAIPEDIVQSPEIFWAKCLWSIPTAQEYETLLEQSEYAAWLSTMGLQANHFTISINHLKRFTTIESVNQLLLDKDYPLNESGGVIKGSPEVFLEQSSTMADKRLFTFSDGEERTIATCFYEFARRHEMPNGILFDSFIEGNADKVFDSTHMQ